MPLTNEQLSALIGDIYESALNRAHWVTTLERVAVAFNGCGANLMSRSEDGYTFDYIWGSSAETRQSFIDTYSRIDPVGTLDWHVGVDDPISMERFMPLEELKRTQFYREFLQPLGWIDFCLVLLEKSVARISIFGIIRHISQGPPGAREFALMRLLTPHMRRAAIFHNVVDRETTRADDLAAALNHVQVPILLFDAAGHCVETNAAADRFLAETDSVRLTSDGIRSQVRALSLRAGATPPPGAAGPEIPGAPPAQSMALTQSDGRRFVAHIMPLTGGLQNRLTRQPRAVSAMLVQQVGALQPLPGEVLVKLYGLTPAETRLLSLLAQDRTLEESAAVLGIAMTTARTHLQHIFDKTGTSRQSQVIRLVLSAFPQSPPPSAGRD